MSPLVHRVALNLTKIVATAGNAGEKLGAAFSFDDLSRRRVPVPGSRFGMPSSRFGMPGACFGIHRARGSGSRYPPVLVPVRFRSATRLIICSTLGDVLRPRPQLAWFADDEGESSTNGSASGGDVRCVGLCEAVRHVPQVWRGKASRSRFTRRTFLAIGLLDGWQLSLSTLPNAFALHRQFTDDRATGHELIGDETVFVQ